MIKNNGLPIPLWRYRVGSLSLIGIIAVAFTTDILPVQAALLAKWGFDPNRNQLEFTLQDRTTPRYFLLAQPPRIVLELPNTQMGKVATVQNYSGLVREVRVAQFEENLTRIVLELSPEVVLVPEMVQLEKVTDGKGDRWLLRPLIARTPPTPQLPSALPSTNNSIQQTNRNSTQLQQGAINSVRSTTTTSTTSTTLPPATFNSQQPAFVSVPPLSPTTSTKPEASLSENVIQFGDPLPTVLPVTATPGNSLPILQPDTPVLPEADSTTLTTETPVVVPTLK